MGRHRLAAALAAAVAVIAATVMVVVVAAALVGSAISTPEPSVATDVSEPTGIALLRTEIAALVDAGTPEGDPRLEMLEDELVALREGVRTDAPAEPGVELSDVGADAARRELSDPALWDDGPVACEPIPPDLLTAEELVGATCRSELRPDGSGLYVATRPGGREVTVRFGADGTVTRTTLGGSAPEHPLGAAPRPR